MKNIKKQQKQLSRKLSFIQEKPYFLRICKRNNVVSFVVAVLFFAVSFVPTVYSADIIPPTLITEAWISDNTVGNYIADGGVVSLDDINEAGEFITIYFSASDGSGLYNHKAQVKMGAGPWITLVDCWDADMDEYCGFMGDIRITDLKSDSTGDIPQLQIGPFNDGDVISYRSSATDTVLPVGNTGWSFEKSFTVKAETWIRSFNEGNDTFEAYDVLQVSDGYIIAGSRKISIFDPITWTVIGQRRFSLTKLDNKGFVIWSRDYGDAVDNGFTLARSIKQTSDLGYVIAGHTTAYGSEEDLTVLKVDSVGNKEWYKVIAGVNRDYAVEILQLPSPGLGYVIAGHTSSYDVNENVHDAMIIKLDSNGNKIWEKTTNTASDAYIFDFQKTSNNNYIGVGMSGSKANIFKLDSSFNLLWSKKVNGGELKSITEVSDGNYIIVGAYNGDFLIIKVDSNGNKIWQKVYDNSGSDYFYSVSQTLDGGFIAFGQTFNASGSDVVLVKFDSDGNKEWGKDFGGIEDDYAFSVKQTVDKGYIAVGWEESAHAVARGMYLIKTDSNGNVDSCLLWTDVNLVAIAGGPPYANDNKFTFSAPSGLNISSPAIETGNPALVDNIVCPGPSPNIPPTVTTNPVLPINYCASNLPAGIELKWDFNDTEDGIIQTGYEINLMRDGIISCNIVKNPDSAIFITGPDINVSCPGFIYYGNHTYTWEIKVYDSEGAESGFVAEPSSFPSSPTPDHRYPIANFDCTPIQPPATIIQFQSIDFNPSIAQTFGGFSVANWTWNFGNGSPLVSIDNPPNTDGETAYSYPAVGLYTVDLKITDSSPQAYSCWASQKIPTNTKDIIIGDNLPKWNEINP